jgi:hypothetical protein
VRVTDAGTPPFDRETRVSQLTEFAAVCADLAARFGDGDRRMAQAFEILARHAQSLLRDGFEQEALTTLTRDLPLAPDWLNPKALDARLRQEPWQRAIAAPWVRLRELALDLRTVGRA